MKTRTSSLIGILMMTLVSSDLLAQAGVSSASASRARAESEMTRPPYLAPARPVYDAPALSYAPPAPDRIAVEEIVNYRRHVLPLPKSGEGVALDVRWGNEAFSPGQPAV